MQHCYGGYTNNLTLEEFLHEDNFFAFQLFGQPLPPDHGGPLRLVVPHLYAWKSSKWINGLEFLDGGSIVGSSQFSILPQLPPKTILNDSKVVKIDPKKSSRFNNLTP